MCVATGDDTAQDDVVRRLLSIRQYRGNGQRAPHKPLLILLALGRLAQTGTSEVTWSEAEKELTVLLNQFGPPSETTGAAAVAYPYTRLRNDGFWTLSRDVPNDSVRALREAPITGQLDSAIEESFRSHPEALFEAAVRLTLQQFPASFLGDVLEAVGLDVDPGVLGALATDQVNVHRRRQSWRDDILRAWEHRCAFCEFDGRVDLSGGTSRLVGIEAAHVRWFNFGGPDDLDNGLALCSLHHKLLDRGVLGFAAQDEVAVSSLFTTHSDAGRQVYDLHGRRLTPRPGTELPGADHVAWHSAEVFLRPAV
jgi:putative restriction endonuclease